MSDTDLTASPAPDLPTMLHLLAAHITENPIPSPYAFCPLWSGGVRITFYGKDLGGALAFAASLSDRALRVEAYPEPDSAKRPFFSITVNGIALALPVEVVVNPDAIEGDTVESVTAFVESELATLAAESRETTAMAGAQS
jgi:hypothetical protein